MVAIAEIQLSEEATTLELIQQLIDDQDGELVLHYLGVELTVVDAESPCLVLLTHQQHQHGEGGRAGPDDALAQHVIAQPSSRQRSISFGVSQERQVPSGARGLTGAPGVVIVAGCGFRVVVAPLGLLEERSAIGVLGGVAVVECFSLAHANPMASSWVSGHCSSMLACNGSPRPTMKMVT
jgi:hypothetical protein